jgi:hypothetical protein
MTTSTPVFNCLLPNVQTQGTERCSTVVNTPVRIRELQGSNLSPGYPEWDFSWFSSVPTRQFRGSALNLATTASFHNLCNSSFIYRPFIRRYIVWVSEKASQGKLQTHKQQWRCYSYTVHTTALQFKEALVMENLRFITKSYHLILSLPSLHIPGAICLSKLAYGLFSWDFPTKILYARKQSLGIKL